MGANKSQSRLFLNMSNRTFQCCLRQGCDNFPIHHGEVNSVIDDHHPATGVTRTVILQLKRVSLGWLTRCRLAGAPPVIALGCLSHIGGKAAGRSEWMMVLDFATALVIQLQSQRYHCCQKGSRRRGGLLSLETLSLCPECSGVDCNFDCFL